MKMKTARRWIALAVVAVPLAAACIREIVDFHPDDPYTCVVAGPLYDRTTWGSPPPVSATATPTWTLPSDSVPDARLIQDRHVSTYEAHRSGGCYWSDAKKDSFTSYARNLNPTTVSFDASKDTLFPHQLTGIAARIIDTAPEKCRYARQHAAVKRRWSLLPLGEGDDTVDAWLEEC
ncbi:MAG: hypothetical protein J4F34_09145 [Gemmatimonadetes bacterium]|nr:hypothetical protein [Gemmatimonadota bacterium]